MSFTEIVGWIANCMFLSAYLLVSTKRIEGSGKAFNFLNLGGAVCYGIYAVINGSASLLVLEIFWSTIALVALYRAFRSK